MAAQNLTREQRFWLKVKKTETCWLWVACICRRYGLFFVGNGKFSTAHRFSWELTHGQVPDGLWVLHRCDVPTCVRPDHLFLGTNYDNTQDKVRKGRHQRGERTYNHKITETQARSIRESRDPQRVIARQFGIDQALVWRIKHRKSWAHI